ncbi:hypothetical protein BpHYR1_031424 [Brachionus plicatilis]|uniref:Uncharacterized protein n=1 Tax=Brachionus plicatilis TaxID=10195 RepID=A0A3M7SWG0_BRAPC|nr:hypothetical protein BpHYR1_031424 [Brachionus plicatilis]
MLIDQLTLPRTLINLLINSFLTFNVYLTKFQLLLILAHPVRLRFRIYLTLVSMRIFRRRIIGFEITY